MANHFVGCKRGQLLLIPPSLTEWLRDDHLVWTILGAVGEMDLERFYADYRLGGAGRPVYDPAMLARRYFSTHTRAGAGPRERSSGSVWRTSPTR